MDRPQRDQFVMTPVVHSTLAYPRTGLAATPTTAGVSPLDLTAAIAHELRRANGQPGWPAWDEATPGSQYEAETIPYGAFLSPATARQQLQQPPQLIPQYIPRFDEGLQGPPAMLQRFDHSYVNASESESYASAEQEFYSRSSNGLPSLHPTHQAFQGATRGDSGRSCSPWIERMLHSDVTPTPCPSGPSLGDPAGTTSCLQTREQTGVSCVASQTVDPQSCHGNDMQQHSSEKSMRSALSSDGPHAHESSALESFSADLCSDDDDLETRPMDVKRKKRMLSNRASAQRSRQRRQERLDQLEVLTAQLRVENSTLQKKLSAANQLAKKNEDLNKNLAKQVERLSKELQEGDVKTSARECASSQQTTSASSCEMVGEQVSFNDGASSPPRPSAVSPARKSSSAWPKKRSHDQLEPSVAFGGGSHMSTSRSLGCMASRPTRPTSPSSPTSHGFATTTTTAFLESAIRSFSHIVNEPAASDPGLKVDDSNLDCLDSDRWFEFADCFM